MPTPVPAQLKYLDFTHFSRTNWEDDYISHNDLPTGCSTRLWLYVCSSNWDLLPRSSHLRPLHLPQPVPLTFRERWIYVPLILAFVSSYLAQDIDYLSRMAKEDWVPPKHSSFHVLSSVLIWGLLTKLILTNKPIYRQPYTSIFILQCLFEITLRILDQQMEVYACPKGMLG